MEDCQMVEAQRKDLLNYVNSPKIKFIRSLMYFCNLTFHPCNPFNPCIEIIDYDHICVENSFY